MDHPIENPWKITDKKAIYDNPWIGLTEFQVINPSGNPGIYGKIHFKNIAIGIIPLDEELNTYLVGQYRFPLEQYSWEIPEGGGILGIDPIDSAKRELLEETGLKANNWTEIQRMHLSNSVSDELSIIYLARDLSQFESEPEDTEQLLPIQWICYRFFGYTAHKRSVDLLNLCLLRTFYLTANHQSLGDIPPLIYYLRKYHAKFISKIELTKGIPSISFNLKYGGGANIDRKDSRQSITEIVKLATRMKENKWSAVIFPEGTRSKDGIVKTFQVGGIATILKKCPDALLVPIAIDRSWEMVRYGSYPLNTFTRMTWEILEPIEPNGQPIENLVLEAENKIKASLGQI
eukprot:gene8673-8765_t